MKMQLVMAAAAISILMTSAAFGANSFRSSHRGSTGPEGTPRGGDRYTVLTDDEQLMCKVAGNPDGNTWAPPNSWAHAIAHLRQEGDIRCAPSKANGM